MLASKVIRLASSVVVMLAHAHITTASVLPQSERNLKDLKEQHDQAIHTNTQACVPVDNTSWTDYGSILIAFLTGMFVMFASKYAFDQWKAA